MTNSDKEMWEHAIRDAELELVNLNEQLLEVQKKIRRFKNAIKIFKELHHENSLWPKEIDNDE